MFMLNLTDSADGFHIQSTHPRSSYILYNHMVAQSVSARPLWHVSCFFSAEHPGKATTLVALVILGGTAAYAGGTSVTKGAVRVAFWGALAMGITAGVSKLFGAAV